MGNLNKPEKVEKVALPLPESYIYVDMNREVLALGQYCDRAKGGNPNDYYCRNLERVLFRNVNYRVNKDNYFFNNSTIGSDNWESLEKDTEWTIARNIKDLMKDDQHPAVIADTCKQFSEMCERYRTHT